MKNKSTKNEKNSINMMKSQHRTRFGMKRTVSDMPNIFAQLSSAMLSQHGDIFSWPQHVPNLS